MDAALKRHSLLVTALAPLIPPLVGSAFNIWYNIPVIDPLLRAAGLRDRFVSTVIVWNAVAYPAAVVVWLWLILLLRPTYQRLARGEGISAQHLDPLRRRPVPLPSGGAAPAGLRACA